MSPSMLRVLHLLALKEYGAKISSVQLLELQKTPYERFSSYVEFINYLKGRIGASNLPGEKHWNYALRIYEVHSRVGVSMIAITDPEYPRYLRAIDDAPAIIYIRGNTKLLRELPGVSVVGTRKVTAAGAIITSRISQYLTTQNWVIVSGLAIGVDAIAHKACLDSNGKTIAVLANGLDEAQPKQNAELGQRILEEGGAWISEHPIGTKVEKRFFVQRNRIQLGLSAGSVIIEAETNSGTMTQAQFCAKQRRPLFAVVPESTQNPLNLLSAGTLKMVSEMGAMPLRNKDDYADMLASLSQQRAMMAGII